MANVYLGQYVTVLVEYRRKLWKRNENPILEELWKKDSEIK